MDDQFKLYDLEVEVIGDPGQFACGHTLGVAFKVQGEDIVFRDGAKFSMYSMAAIIPLLPSKQRKLDKNDWMLSDNLIACPDPLCKAQFKINRTGESIFRTSEVTKSGEKS